MARIFISYRRSEQGEGQARAIYEKLKAAFGASDVFFDPQIQPATNFHEHLEKAARECQVLLVLIGANWIASAIERSDDHSEDYVRREFEWARAGRANFVPILLEEMKWPTEEEFDGAGFPSLAKIQALPLNFGRAFEAGIVTLIATIERLLQPSPPLGSRPGGEGEITGKPPHIKLIHIPGGTFTLGSYASEWGRAADEGPWPNVRVDAFRLGDAPVTNQQYSYFLRDTGYREPLYWENPAFNQPEQPVVGVSLDDANHFCSWANLRLPTEIEWEYACRAGLSGSFGPGSEEHHLTEIGWYKLNSRWQLQRVRQKPANLYGLHDMLGNVAEWCRHPYVPDLAHAESIDADSEAPASRYVVRGGAWDCPAAECRCAARRRRARVHRSPLIGFRLAQSLAARPD